MKDYNKCCFKSRSRFFNLYGDITIRPFLVFFVFFLSVLRQFKIVKSTRQPGEKTNKLLKTKLSLDVVRT
jgi:hypothetical protein